MKVQRLFSLRAMSGFLILILLVAACGEQEVTIKPTIPNTEHPQIEPDLEHDVYLAFNESIDGKWVPSMVKPDGSVIRLSDGERIKTGQTVGMFVSENRDVYIAGSQTNANGQMYPLYWKNEVPVFLGDTALSIFSVPTSLRVVNDDMYITGTKFNSKHSIAIYWRNGEVIELTDGTSDAIADNIFISGDDIYVGGSIKNKAGKYEAYYWKNGIPTKVNGTYVSSVFVSGQDVYLAGDFGPGKYWKNGSYLTLAGANTIGSKSSGTSLIRGFNNDVYVTGVGEYWKNGESVVIGGSTNTPALYDLFAFGDDVYTGGFQHDGSFLTARYWKNGIGVSITDGKHNAAVSSIFVVAKNP